MIRSLVLLALITSLLYGRVLLVDWVPGMWSRGSGWTASALVLLFVIGVGSLVCSWFWQRSCSLTAVLSGIGLLLIIGVAVPGESWLTAFFYGSPFAVAGLLSYWDWHAQQTAVQLAT